MADVQHGGDPARQLVVGGHHEPRAGLPQHRAGAGEALGHRAGGHEVGGRDLRHAQAGHRPQAERHLRRPAQRGVAAQQEQAEGVVDPRVRRFVRTRCAGRLVGRRARTRASRLPRAESARNRSISRRDATRTSHPRGSSGTPSTGHWAAARDRGVLDRVLAVAEVAVPAQQCTEDVRRLPAPHVLEDRFHRFGYWSAPPGHIVGRSSTVSPGPVKLRDDLLGPWPGSRRRSGRTRRGAPWPPSTGRRWRVGVPSAHR